MKKTKILLKSLAFFVLATAFVVEFLWLVVPRFVDSGRYKNFVVAEMKRVSGADFSYDNLILKTYPDFSAKVIVENPNLDGFFSSKDFDLNVGLTKILLNKLVIKDLKINNANLFVDIYKDGTTNLDTLLANDDIDFDIKKTKINIDNYGIFINDNRVNQKTDIKGKLFDLKTGKKKLNMVFDSVMSSQNEKSDINLNVEMPLPDIRKGFKNTGKYFFITGHIKNLKPKMFEGYVKTYLDKDVETIDGIINAEFKPSYVNGKLKNITSEVFINNFKIISKHKENSVIFDEKVSINYEIFKDDKDFELKDFKFTGKNFNIFANGKISNYASKSSHILMDIDIKNSRFEALYQMLPSTLFTDNNEIKKLKKYGAYADVNGSIKLKGALKKPEAYGKINITDMWILDGLASEVPKAVIKVQLIKDKADVAVQVWATPDQWVKVRGWSDFFDIAKNDYYITSTDNVPLEIVEKELVPISDTVGFVIGPVPVMDIVGLGNIDLNVHGSKEDPYLKGYFRFKNTTASFNGINFKLTNSDGKIDFDEDKIYFKADKALAYGKNVSLTGECSVYGDVDFKALVKNVPLQNLLTVLKTSPMLKAQTEPVKVITSANGLSDLELNIKGKILDIYEKDFMKYLKPDGVLNIHNANVKISNPDLNLTKMNGLLKFEITKSNYEIIDLDLTSNMYKSPIKVVGKIGKFANIKISSNKMRLVDAIRFAIDSDSSKKMNINLAEIPSDTTFALDMKYKGNPENIEPDKVNLSAIFGEKKNVSSEKAIIDILSGSLYLNNGNVKANKVKSKFYNTTADFDGKINNVFKKPVVTMDLSVVKLDLKMINYLKDSSFIPQKYLQIINAYENFNGDLTARLNVKNNNLNGKVWFRNVAFIHSVLKYPFSVKSADLTFKNNQLDIESLNASFAGTPIFLNGNIKNIFKNKGFDVYFTSKLSSNFVDNYINTNLSYPINVKGEILLSARIKGDKNAINFYPVIKLEEGADVYYMGANFGGENSVREIKGDFYKSAKKFIINNLDYSKYIYSQTNRAYALPLVKLNAELSFLKNNDVYIDKLNVKTLNPINANLFNALFKKSLVKNGNVNCDLSLKGNIKRPKILGFLTLKNVEIPSYETSIENLNADFSQKYIDINAKTSYMGSEIDLISKIKNNQSKVLHFENFELYSKRLDMGRLLDSFNEISYSRPIQIVGKTAVKDEVPINANDIIVDNGKLTIDDLALKTLSAKAFSAKLKIHNNNFELNDINFDVADGKINGDFVYNFKKALVKANLEAQGVNANEIASGAFDLKNQIYGKLDGKIAITTFGASDEERLKNLNGELNFSIVDGKMPKLGSIEYLLRAGNLIKSGISGLTINSITGLLIPVQSGSFNEIKGELGIKDGVAHDIKMYSKGDTLSILLMGDYDLLQSKADIYVLGKLSKKIETVFGPFGNASLNTFFNLIPGVNLDELGDSQLVQQINSIPELGIKSDKFRIFRAKVDGDIYSDKFVSIFEWIDK